MRLIKSHPLLTVINSYVIDNPQPSNISYLWNYGSLLAVCLGTQIVTGVILAMHYCPSVDLAFITVEHIMRDVNYGWLLRYLHANGASFFFIFVYLHISRGLYYGSYKKPTTLVWSIGVIIFIVMIGTAFMGYVLPYGQMSLWGATVITNLLSAIPIIGKDLVELVWGGFSVSNATLNRFFSLHYLLPFILAALAIMHMVSLHHNGSNNPLGVTGNLDRLPMHPYYNFKDLVTIILFFIVISYFIFYTPNALGHSDNYIPANPMQTPMSIVPEWYLLPFYAILRSIPNKLLGVIAMFAALVVLLVLPFTDTSKIRACAFKPVHKFMFWVFVGNFFILAFIGSMHVEDPYILIGQLSTTLYFAYFLIILPISGIIDNTLYDLISKNK